MKIVLEREKCIGCGSCAMLCPKYFRMADDGKSELLGGEKDTSGNIQMEIPEITCTQDAADACPIQIIHIEK